MPDGKKIVDFQEYCPLCEHLNLPEEEEPCRECLATPVNAWSHKPIRFVKNKNKEKKR